MSQKAVFSEEIWAGSEHSLRMAMDAHARILSGTDMKAGLLSARGPDDDEVPYLFSEQGGIGVISIRGSLVNNDSVWNRFFGQTSYADIRRAVMYAANQADVKHILLDINSGGGAVSGLADTADLISHVAKVKPMTAFAEGTMASAAYWLGVSAKNVYSSKTSMVGSIGILAVHMEYSKALKDDGVGVTVARSGEHKALVNPYEPLSERARAQLQGQMDQTYAIFIDHVASHLGLSVAQADAKIGQGREFIGQAAVDAGLSKGITSFDALMSKIGAKIAGTQGTLLQNGNLGMTKKAMTEVELAAIAAGIQPDPKATTPATETPAVPAASASTAPAVTESQEVKPVAPAAAPVAPAADPLATVLQTQLDAANAQVVDLKVKLAQAQGEAAAAKASLDPMKAIVAASIGTMRVAMNLPKVDASAMTAEAVLADHKSLAEQFTKSFKAGGVAAVSATEDTKPKVDPNHLARVGATRLGK